MEVKEMINGSSALDDLRRTIEKSLNPPQPPKRIYTGSELLTKDVKKIPCLLDPVFPAVGIGALAGSSDGGKSAFGRNLAVSVVAGQSEFIGFKVNAKKRRAIYVSTEDDENSVAYLLQRLNNQYKMRPDSLSGFTLITETENLLQTLEKELEDNPADLIVLDTFADLYGKSMNEANQVRTFLNDYSQLAQKYECFILFLHHTGKRTDDFAPSKHNLLGSQGFESKMRVVVEMRLDRNYNTKRHFCIVKGNYLPREYKDSSFVLDMDEYFYYSFTGERVPFAELAGDDNTQNAEVEKNIVELSHSGMKQTEIAVQLNVSQSKVSRVLRKNQ